MTLGTLNFYHTSMLTPISKPITQIPEPKPKPKTQIPKPNSQISGYSDTGYTKLLPYLNGDQRCKTHNPNPRTKTQNLKPKSQNPTLKSQATFDTRYTKLLPYLNGDPRCKTQIPKFSPQPKIFAQNIPPNPKFPPNPKPKSLNQKRSEFNP